VPLELSAFRIIFLVVPSENLIELLEIVAHPRRAALLDPVPAMTGVRPAISATPANAAAKAVDNAARRIKARLLGPISLFPASILAIWMCLQGYRDIE
jgi:hypothetical protein